MGHDSVDRHRRRVDGERVGGLHERRHRAGRVAAVALGGWFWGPLSDRIGRRASLVAASALIVVPSALVPLAPSFGTLLALPAGDEVLRAAADRLACLGMAAWSSDLEAATSGVGFGVGPP